MVAVSACMSGTCGTGTISIFALFFQDSAMFRYVAICFLWQLFENDVDS